jgi:hypothetical protein
MLTNIFIAVSFWLSQTNAGPGSFTVMQGAKGVQSIDTWTYKAEQPSIEWLTTHEHEAESWYAGPKAAADLNQKVLDLSSQPVIVAAAAVIQEVDRRARNDEAPMTMEQLSELYQTVLKMQVSK